MATRSRLLLAVGLCCLWASPAAALTDAEGAEPASTGTASPSIYSTSVVASSAAASEGSTSGWEFAFTPYLWASAMKVDVETPQGEDIKVDESFTDILDILKFAFMGAFEVKHGRFVSVQDLMFIHTNSSADGHIGPIPLEADADMKMLSTTHLFGYRVLDDGPMFVDLFAGGRITTIKVALDISGPQQTFERDAKKTQFGPVIASRFRAPLGGKWGAAIYGDIGGFGVGADLSWQLLGTVQYDLSDRWRLAAGWRHFSAKQSNKGFDVHMRLDGPILGAVYRF